MSELEQQREQNSDLTDKDHPSDSSGDTKHLAYSTTETSQSPSRSPSPPSQRKEEVEEPVSVESRDGRQTEERMSDTDDYEGEYAAEQSEEGEGSLRLDLGYTEDEPPPDYDVTERVRQLNAELAADPVPEEDDRERSIKFKDNLVDLVAPPADYDEDEEDDGAKSARDTPPSETTETGAPTTSNDEQGDGSRTTGRGQSRDGDGSGDESGEMSRDKSVDIRRDGSADGEDKVVVERSGQFDVVSSKELTAEERILYGIDEPEQEHCEDKDQDLEKDSSHEPSPPAEPRPVSADNSSGNRSQNNRSQRAHSAKELYQATRGGEFDPSDFEYHSPYAQSGEDKKRLQKQKENREKKEKERKEKEGKHEEEKNSENNDAFNAWLHKKREDAAARRHQYEEERKKQRDGENNRDPEGAFEEWIKVKKQQDKTNRNENQLRMREGEQGWYTRPRSQCDLAFKQWLKKKNQDLVKEKNEAKQKARLHSLLARKSRKSVALARAIKQAQAFRYVDYYGYRY